MNWSDERYVRLYTRDSTDWLMWPWESRAVLPLLLRKLDRAGTMQLGRYGIRGLATTIGLPAEVAQAGIDGLLDDGCVQINGDILVMPNFLEAQEAKQSDKVRQAESRARRRDSAQAVNSVTKRDTSSQNVTECHTRSHGVTGGHTASHDVTPSRAVPCLSVPNRAEPKIPLSASADRVVEQPGLFTQEPTDDAASGDARAVFDHWCSVMQKGGKTSFDAKRRAKVNARIKDGYTAEQLCKAVDGCAMTPHNMGANDRGEKYNDLELICRDSSHVDRFIQNADTPPVAKVGNDISQAAKAAFERVGFIHDF